MEYDSLSRCLGGEMVDTRDSKSRAKERGGSSPLQGIILSIIMILRMDNSSKSCSFATKYFLRASVKKNIFFWRERLFHQSSHRYLTYSYLKIFHKVVTKRITCTNLSIFQFDPIHSFVELFIRSQTFLEHL